MTLDPPRDLEPKGDVKAGSPRTPPKGIPVQDYQKFKINGHHLPSLGNMLQILQIIAILLFAVAWWSKRESVSEVSITSQNLAIKANTARLEAIDKRFENIDARADKAMETAAKNSQDLHELMVKFRIMVELVDGQQKQPELRK